MLDTDVIYGTLKGRLTYTDRVLCGYARSVNVVTVFNAFDYNGRAHIRGQCERSLNSSIEQFNVCDRRDEQHVKAKFHYAS